MAKPKTKKTKVKLTPADLTQCQAEKSNGVNFMTMGGRHEMIRCKSEPHVVVTETVPSPKDGQCGEMSMCASCLVVFLNQAEPGSKYLYRYIP